MAIVIFHSREGASGTSADCTLQTALADSLACIHTSLPSRVLLICVMYDENFYLKNAKSLSHTFPVPPQGVSSGYVKGIEAQLLLGDK